MIQNHLYLAGIALLGLLIGAGCSNDNDDGFGLGTPSPDDNGDDDDDDDFVEEDRSAYIEFARSEDFGTGESATLLFSSWFNPTHLDPRIPMPPKVDTCTSGEHVLGTYGVPVTTHDVGTPSITLPDGSEIEMNLNPDGEYWTGVTSANDWQSNEDYDAHISGGSDREGADYMGALATPSILTITDFDYNLAGLDLQWYGANNNGHVELRISHRAEGETELITYVACRLFDDGEHRIEQEDLEPILAFTTEVELLRATTGNFPTEKGPPGMASGIAIATHTWTPEN